MIEWNGKETNINKEGYTIIYLYTPLCGTCQVAKKMLTVVDEMMSDLTIYSLNLNYYPQDALQWAVESVPCLLVFKDEKILERVYAFQSVGYLYDVLKRYAA